MVLHDLPPAARTLLDHPLDACCWTRGEAWCSRAAAHGAYCAAHHRASRSEYQGDYSPMLIAKMLRMRPRAAA